MARAVAEWMIVRITRKNWPGVAAVALAGEGEANTEVVEVGTIVE